MIFLEFGQIVRVNFTTDLFFVYLVRDGHDLWLYPVDEDIASGRNKVAFDVSSTELRQLPLRDVKNVEILHTPKEEERGVCRYYGFQPNLLVDIVFQFCKHMTFRFRIVDLEQDKLSLMLVDTSALARLPPVYAKKMYFIDFGFRGVNPIFEFFSWSVRDPISSIFNIPSFSVPNANGLAETTSISSTQTQISSTYPFRSIGSKIVVKSSFLVSRAKTLVKCEEVTKNSIVCKGSVQNTTHLYPLLHLKKTEREEDDDWTRRSSYWQHSTKGLVPSFVHRPPKEKEKFSGSSSSAPSWSFVNQCDLRFYKETGLLVLPWVAVQHILPMHPEGNVHEVSWTDRLTHLITVENIPWMQWIRASIRLPEHRLNKREDWDSLLIRRQVLSKTVMNVSDLFWWKVRRFTCPLQSIPNKLMSKFGMEMMEREAARNRQIWKSTLAVSEQYILPKWKKMMNQARKFAMTTFTGPDHPWTGIKEKQNRHLVISWNTRELEKMLLFQTRFCFLSYLTQTSFSGSDDISSSMITTGSFASLGKRRFEETAAFEKKHTSLLTNYRSPASFQPPASILILNAKVLAKEFDSETDCYKSCSSFSTGGNEGLYFDKHLDDIPYEWLDFCSSIEKQILPAQFVEYLCAVLREQKLPEITPSHLIPFLAECLAYRKRPVQKGHFAFIRSTGKFMIWSGSNWIRPTFDIDSSMFHNCVSIHPCKFVTIHDSKQKKEGEEEDDNYQRWNNLQNRVLRKDYSDFQQRNTWTPLPPSLEDKSLEEHVRNTISYFQCWTATIFATENSFREKAFKVLHSTTTSPLVKTRERICSEQSSEEENRHHALKRLANLRLQLQDAARNHQDLWTLLQSHADHVGGYRWRLRKSNGLEFSFSSIPVFYADQQDGDWRKQPFRHPTYNEDDEENIIELFQYTFNEFALFMTQIQSESPLGRCFQQFQFHSIWYRCWRSSPFQVLIPSFFVKHYRLLKTNAENRLTAWFSWLLILYYLFFQFAPTRNELYPVLAASGYPYQYQQHPEKLLEDYSMPQLLLGLFSPFVVRVPTIDDIQQSPILETLWLLLHQQGMTTNSKEVEVEKQDESSVELSTLEVQFTSYQDKVRLLQEMFNREYDALLQSKWMDTHQWEKFQLFRPEELDYSERIRSYLQIKCSSWPTSLLTPIQLLFTQFDDQSISHGQFSVNAKRTLHAFGKHRALDYYQHLSSYWKESQQDIHTWMFTWHLNDSAGFTEKTVSVVTTNEQRNDQQKQQLEVAEKGMKEAAVTWWNDSSSVFVYSWRGGTREIVQRMTTRYLKSLYLFSTVAFVVRNQQDATISKFE